MDSDEIHRQHWEPWVKAHPGQCMAISETRTGARRMCRNRVRFLVDWRPVCGVHLSRVRRAWMANDDQIVEVRVVTEVRLEPVKASRRKGVRNG
jgi:hypothetical protein